MDDLVALVIKKLREDDGSRRGMVALASWWHADKRLNLMVQPVVRNGRLSYNILKSKWESVDIGNARWCASGNYGWAAVSDDQIKAFPRTVPVCNFQTLEQTANFLMAMGRSGECPIKGGVRSMVVGANNNDLFRGKGAQCDKKEDVLTWLHVMHDMRAPVPATQS